MAAALLTSIGVDGGRAGIEIAAARAGPPLNPLLEARWHPTSELIDGLGDLLDRLFERGEQGVDEVGDVISRRSGVLLSHRLLFFGATPYGVVPTFGNVLL